MIVELTQAQADTLAEVLRQLLVNSTTTTRATTTPAKAQLARHSQGQDLLDISAM